jgi:hypothetical protein
MKEEEETDDEEVEIEEEEEPVYGLKQMKNYILI